MEELDASPEVQRKFMNRPASEWFVREKDEWYWGRTKRLVEESEKKTATWLIICTAISVAVSSLAAIISYWLCKLK